MESSCGKQKGALNMGTEKENIERKQWKSNKQKYEKKNVVWHIHIYVNNM